MMTMNSELQNRKKKYLLAGVIFSAVIHLPILLLRVVKPDAEKKSVYLPSDVKVTIKVRPEIIEAPLPKTEEIPLDSAKGRQDHFTKKETRLPPTQSHEKGADASRFSNKSGQGGKLKPKEGYGGLLPSEGELSAYNDFVADPSIPIGKVLDINTTDYRYIGYTTAIRKSVDLAFYSPRSALKNEPHIKEKLESGEKTRFSGKSVAVLTIDKSGMLSEVKIVESSGDKTIDEEWLHILNMAAPFPPIPNSYDEQSFVIQYTLYYDYIFREDKKLRRFQF